MACIGNRARRNRAEWGATGTSIAAALLWGAPALALAQEAAQDRAQTQTQAQPADDLPTIVDDIDLALTDPDYNLEQMRGIISLCSSGDVSDEVGTRARYERLHSEVRATVSTLIARGNDAAGTPAGEGDLADARKLAAALDKFPVPDQFDCYAGSGSLAPGGSGVAISGRAEGGITAGSEQSNQMFTADERAALEEAYGDRSVGSPTPSPGASGVSISGNPEFGVTPQPQAETEGSKQASGDTSFEDARQEAFDDSREAYIKAYLRRPFGFGYGEATFQDRPSTGIGFQRAGAPGTAPEEFAGEVDPTISTFGAGAEVKLDNIHFTLAYAEGDSSAALDIAAGGGVDTGVVYGELSPGGSSGIATPFGLGGALDYDFSQFSIEAGYEIEVYISANQDLRIVTEPHLWLGVSDSEIRAGAAGSGMSAGALLEFSQTREQEVKDRFAGLGAKTQISFANEDVAVHLFGSAAAYYLSSELSSLEVNISNFGPTPDRDFAVAIDRDKDTIGFRGTAGTEFDLLATDQFALTVGAEVEYCSDVGAVFNPNSGDQVFFDGLTTDLETDDAWNWRVYAGVKVGF